MPQVKRPQANGTAARWQMTARLGRVTRALVLPLMLIAAPAWADWQYLETFTDPIDGYNTRAATTTNADGVALHFYRNPIGRVYVLFTLPAEGSDLISDGPVAILTPQGFASKEIEARTSPGRVVEYGRSNGRALRDRLWHGEGDTPIGTLRNIIDAPVLSATFTLTSGDTVQTEWDMTGAGLPLAQAIGISIDGIAAGQEWETAASQALLAAMTVCQFPKLDITCVQKVTACSSKISDERDIDGFEACVAEGG